MHIMVNSLLLDLETFIPSYKVMFYKFLVNEIDKRNFEIPNDFYRMYESYDINAILDWMLCYVKSDLDTVELYIQFEHWLKQFVGTMDCPDELESCIKLCEDWGTKLAIITHGTRRFVRTVLERWCVMDNIDYLVTDHDFSKGNGMVGRVVRNMTEDTLKCIGVTSDFDNLMHFKRAGVKVWFVQNDLNTLDAKFLNCMADKVLDHKQELIMNLEKEVR